MVSYNNSEYERGNRKERCKMSKPKKNKAKTKDTEEIKMEKAKKMSYLKKDPYTFDNFEDWVWRKYESSHTVDIKNFIETNKEALFFIGTDSQNYSKSNKCVFTSVVIAYRLGKGGCIARYTDKRPMIPVSALSARLMVETQRSIEICQFVETTLFDLSDDEIDYTNNIVGISIDVSSDLKNKSGRYKDMLVGLVMGYGFNALVKPDSWASSSVADRKC
jgi:predicted RNase H-related nuclease YkuK (DUF458 family)